MKKFKFPLLAALLVAAAGVFAFTLPGKTGKTFSTYHYTSNSTSLEEMQKVENWEGVSPAEGCDVTGAIPCTITTSEDLQEYLDSFESAGNLINAASTRRD